MLMVSLIASALIAVPPAVPADGNGPDVRPSTYVGKFYAPRFESYRRCVVFRESRDNVRARNPRSSAAGLYQFLDRAWRVSLTHMVMKEHKDRRREVVALRGKPIHHWPRYWQDAAFWTAFNFGAGAKHWALQGSACGRYMP
jgi:hypothetical protein